MTMQALRMLLWVRWRETRVLLGIVLLFTVAFYAAPGKGFMHGQSWVPGFIIYMLFPGAILFSRQDAKGRSVGLSSHMKRLPLPAWKLVAADLLYTTLVSAAYHTVVAGSILIFFRNVNNSFIGFPLMVVSVAALPTTIIWALQAALWLTGPVNLFAALILMAHALGLVMWMLFYRMDRLEIGVLTVLVSLAASYAVSVWAVGLDRTGRLATLRGRLENLSLFTRSRIKPFASAWQAQVWREGARERGIMLALMAGCLLVAFSIEYSVDMGIRLNPTSWRTDAMIKGCIAGALCAGLLLALRRWRERDTLGAGHMLTLPVSTRDLAVARLRADAGVAALGWVVFLLGWVLSGGWADQTPVRLMAAQLAAGMFLIALLYLAALPALTVLGLTSAYWAFLELFWARDPRNFDLMLDLAMGVLVVFMAGLLVYVFVKRALSLRLMAVGLVPAVLAGLTVPLALSAIGGGGGRFPLFYAAAVGSLMFWPFIAAPLAMQRMRNR
jgi:hypothetical protein